MTGMDWSFPYRSQRMPVLARHVVATSQPLAAQAGLDAMRRGGNAVDAAVAAAITLTVVEPTSNGIGSDAFAIVWDGTTLHGLNASGRAPRGLDATRFRGRDAMPSLGWDAVTVPGAVSAWIALVERFGTLPFETLIETAVDAARHGFLVSPQTAAAWARAEARYRDFDAFGSTFLPGGRAPRTGERFVCADQAETLETIATSRGAAFYSGELASRIAADAHRHGGAMTVEDLATHACEWTDTLSIDYRGWRLHEIPPNGQGIAALVALGIVARFPLDTWEVDSARTLHVQIEAMKLAFADAHRYVGEPETMVVDPTTLLDPAYLDGRAASIDPIAAGDPAYGVPAYSSTVYLAAADATGRMVSFIQSNFEGFGSGVVVPDTGIALQNRGRGFVLTPGHPNEVGGGKRPYHTIIPGFVTRVRANGAIEPVMAFGVMGGPMQPQGHAQVLMRMADHGQNPQAALDAPRWRVEGGRRVVIEPGFAADVYDGLRERGHDVVVADARTVHHGGGQAVLRLDDGWCAASDGRRDGQAVGW